MSFSNIALQERHRESKALRIFLTCSLLGSLIFHLVLLASGIGKYLLSRVPEVENEPVEITLLDTPIEEIEPKPEEVVKPEPKLEPKLEKPEPLPETEPPVIDTSKIKPDLESNNRDRISGGSPAASLPEPIPTQPKIIPQAPVIKQALPRTEAAPFKPFEEPLSPVLPSNPPVTAREKPVIPEPIPEKPEPIPQPKLEPETRTPREFSTPVEPPVEPPATNPQADENLKKLLAEQRDSRKAPREFSTPVQPPMETPATNPQDSGIRDTLSGIRESRDTNNNSNNTAPSSPDSNIGDNDNTPKKRRIIGGDNLASVPNTNDTGTGNGLGSGSGDSIGDGDGRAACRRCDRSYPSWARNKGIEGNITVSVNADAQGNITDVQLISGSGNERLDSHHVESARKWKLKPSSNGRQGVTIITRYELQ